MTRVVPHVVTVPATTANLGPGFDAVGLAVGRHLRVCARPRDGGGPRVVSHGEGAGEISAGDDNLVWRSMRAFGDRHGVAVPDVALEAHNEVPLERGLGSSSAAIVAGLALARAMTSAAVGDLELVALADELEGHPDNVAAALLGGLVACARRGDEGLVVRRVNPSPRLRPLVLVPQDRQLTHEARAVLPAAVPHGDAVRQAARAGQMLAGLVGAWPVDPRAAVDLLHEPTRLAVLPGSGELVQRLRAEGLQAWLSGAGPTVAAMLPGDHDLEARVADIAADAGFVGWEPGIDLAGAVVCPEGGCGVASGAGCVHWPSA